MQRLPEKVVDFTNKTNDEIAAYLMISTSKVCGKFQQSQLGFPSPEPVWKRWVSLAAMFVAVFMGIKEASAQTTQLPVGKTDSLSRSTRITLGEVAVASYLPALHPQQKTYAFNEVDAIPSFRLAKKLLWRTCVKTYLQQQMQMLMALLLLWLINMETPST